MNTAVAEAGDRQYDIVSFGWLATNWCNYNCTYCYSKGSLNDKFSKKDYRSSNHNLVLTRLARFESDFIVDFGGGETATHPYLNEILERLAGMERCKQVMVHTNLSRSLRYYNGLFKHPKIAVSASYHPEYHSEEFINKCIALRENNFTCHVILSDEPKHWPDTLEMIAIAQRYNIKRGCNYLYSTAYKTINYTQEFYDTFGDIEWPIDKKYYYKFDDGTESMLSASQVYARGLNRLTGYKCAALDYIIGFDGSISRTCNGEQMPIILRREQTHKPIVCPQKECNCDVMFNYFKERNKYGN